jgi:HlyD family secretion protein
LVVAVGTIALVATALAAGSDDQPAVRTEIVTPRSLFTTAVGTGQLKPRIRTEVETEISGRIVALRASEGSYVHSGDILFRIEPHRYQVAVARADAELAQAKASAEQVHASLLQSQVARRRAENIAEKSGLVANVELEQARTQLASLEAQYRAAGYAVEQARVQLADAQDALRRTTVRAPISGTVTRLRVRMGELTSGAVGPSASLATIADLSTIEAVVRLNETDLPRVHVGDSTTIRLDAMPVERFVGRVARIGRAAIAGGGGQQSALFEVGVSLEPHSRPLYSDLSATAEIVTDRRTKALAVPLLAVVVRDRQGHRRPAARADAGAGRDASTWSGVEGVFIVDGDVARFQPVRTGIVGDQYIEITSGLRGGETVVAGPYQALRELEAGARVGAEEGSLLPRRPPAGAGSR